MPSALSQAIHALADSEPQALGEVLFAKGAVVRWRRERRGHTWNGAISRGQFHRLLRAVRCQCDSEGAGLALYPASAVTERSTMWRAIEDNPELIDRPPEGRPTEYPTQTPTQSKDCQNC